MCLIYEYTINKKSLNGQGKSIVMVLQKELLVKWRNFHDFAAKVFSWVILYGLQLIQGCCPKLSKFRNPCNSHRKRKKNSEFYWVIQERFLRVYIHEERSLLVEPLSICLSVRRSVDKDGTMWEGYQHSGIFILSADRWKSLIHSCIFMQGPYIVRKINSEKGRKGRKVAVWCLSHLTFRTWIISKISRKGQKNLKNTKRGPNISLGTFNAVQYTLYVNALS